MYFPSLAFCFSVFFIKIRHFSKPSCTKKHLFQGLSQINAFPFCSKSSTVCVTRHWNSLFFSRTQSNSSLDSPLVLLGIWEPSWCQNQEISGLGFEESEREKLGNSLPQGAGTFLCELLVCVCCLLIYSPLCLLALVACFLCFLKHSSLCYRFLFSRKSWGHLVFSRTAHLYIPIFQYIFKWVSNGFCATESRLWCWKKYIWEPISC